MTGFRFSGFEVDTDLGELRRNGYRVPLQPQPFQILCLLLEANGAVVSREALIAALWQGRHLASADQSLNIAIRKLRDALDDSSDQPRFVQTVPRLGHRFAAEFERVSSPPEPVALPADELPAAQPPAEVPPTPAVPTPELGRRLSWIVAAMLVALVVAGVWLRRESNRALGARDIVLVARFEDSTGEKELEGAYEALFESEIAANSSLIVASPDRISDTLKLMRRSHDGRRPDFALAQEVCRRDAGIRGVVGGELRRLDAGYLLSVRLVEPLSGNTVAAASGRAATRAELVGVLSDLASTIRRRMGEAAPQGHPAKPIEKVTTASLQAVRLYSEAQVLALEAKWNAAELLLRKAMQQDPEFPSGWILLAWAVRNQRPEAKEEIEPLLDQALRLASTASDNEALFIRSSVHMIRLEYREAVPYLEALFKADPQHPWASANLSVAYHRAAESEKIPAFARQLQAARPNDPAGYWLAADSGLCSPDSRTDVIGQAADRAVDLVRQRGDERQLLSAKLRGLVTRAAAEWAEGRIESTRKLLDQARELLRGGPLGSHHLHVGAGYLALGMRREAESLFALEQSATFRNNWIWWPAIEEGDLLSVRRGIQNLTEVPPHPLHAFVALRAGRPEIAANVLQRQERLAGTTTPFAVSAANGELALERGQFQEAIRILEPALADLGERSLAEGTLGAQALSRAFRKARRDDEAVRALEAETERPRACGGFLRAAFWMPARLELMQLLESQGRRQDADRIRKELVHYTQIAGPGHIVKRFVGAASSGAPQR